MISIRSSADLERAFNCMMDPGLRHLLTARRDQWQAESDLDLAELVHVIIVQLGDTLAAVEREAGVPFATNLVDGSRFGDRGFVANFEFVERHGRWFEAVMILSDDGFGIALFVPDRIEVDPDITLLLRWCAAA